MWEHWIHQINFVFQAGLGTTIAPPPQVAPCNLSADDDPRSDINSANLFWSSSKFLALYTSMYAHTYRHSIIHAPNDTKYISYRSANTQVSRHTKPVRRRMRLMIERVKESGIHPKGKTNSIFTQNFNWPFTIHPCFS